MSTCLRVKLVDKQFYFTCRELVYSCLNFGGSLAERKKVVLYTYCKQEVIAQYL